MIIQVKVELWYNIRHIQILGLLEILTRMQGQHPLPVGMCIALLIIQM